MTGHVGRRVTVIDLGISNLHSITNALRHVGADVSIAMHGREIDGARRLVLPGVGSFGIGMEKLRERGFSTALRRHRQRSTPLLGICLGMQLLFTDGAEFGASEGLDLIHGQVRAIPTPALTKSPIKVPHIGWGRVHVDRSHPLFTGLGDAFHAYFLHSYRALPDVPSDQWATCIYGPHQICAVTGHGNVIGTQFHPEKSGSAGLAFLDNFLGLHGERKGSDARDRVSAVRVT